METSQAEPQAKAAHHTDSTILAIVAAAIDRAADDSRRDPDGGHNWADYVDTALRDAGVTLHVEQPNGARPNDIARLTDGRMIVLAREDRRGVDRYAIEGSAS